MDTDALEPPEILTSPITQGFECPFCCGGGGGVMHLWYIKSVGHYFLSCDECEQTIDTVTPLSEWKRNFFEEYVSRFAVMYSRELKDIIRILNHKLFNVEESALADLIAQVWSRPNRIWFRENYAFDVDMGEAVGLAGGTKVRIFFNTYANQIVDAYPYP